MKETLILTNPHCKCQNFLLYSTRASTLALGPRFVVSWGRGLFGLGGPETLGGVGLGGAGDLFAFLKVGGRGFPSLVGGLVLQETHRYYTMYCF